MLKNVMNRMVNNGKTETKGTDVAPAPANQGQGKAQEFFTEDAWSTAHTNQGPFGSKVTDRTRHK